MNNIKALRQEKGLSLRALAKLSGVSLSNIHNYELGKSTLTRHSAELVSNALNCTIQQLNGLTYSKTNNVIENLKNMRICEMMSSYEVAEYLGMPQSNYYKIEAGQMSLSVERLQKLCNLYKVPITKLI